MEKTSDQLTRELADARQRLAELEARQAEAAPPAGERRFRALVQNSSDAILLLDADGTIRYASRAAVRILGYQVGELVGRKAVELVHPDDLPRVARLLAQLTREPGLRLTAEYRFRYKDGSWGWGEAVGTNLLADPDVQAILVSSRDITERKRAEARIEYQAHLLANVHDALIATDERYMLTAWNRAAEDMYGWRADEVIGRPLSDVIRSESAEADRVEELRSLSETGRYRAEVVQYRRDGKPIIMEGTVTALRGEDGRITGYVSINRDITERKQTDVTLRLYRDVLEQHVADLRMQERHLALLNEITRAALEMPDLPSMLQTLVDQLGELLDADGCYITLWDEAQRRTIPAAAYGELRETYLSLRPQPGEVAMTEPVLNGGHALVAEDVFNSPYISPRIAAQLPARSVLGLPLIAGDQKLGAALIAFNRPHHFTPDEIARGEQAAAQIALAVAKGRLLEAEREQRALAEALCDAATALNSTLHLDDVLDRILADVGSVVPHDAVNVMLIESGMARVVRRRGYVEDELEPRLFALRFPVADVPSLRRMADTGLPVVVTDTQAAGADWVDFAETRWIRSHVGTPIRIKGQIIGFLHADSAAPGFFSPAHAERLQAFADASAVAIENARLFETAQRRLAEQTALLAASSAITSSLDLATVLGRLAEQMCRAIDATSAYICDWKPETGTSTVLAEYFGPEAAPQERESDLGVTYHLSQEFGAALDFHALLTTNKIVLFHADDPNTPEGTRAHLARYGGRSQLTVPFVVKETVVGYAALWESRRRRNFTPEEIALCQGIAQQAAIAFENARLFEVERLRRQELEAAYRASLSLTTSLDLLQVLDAVLGAALSLMPGQGSAHIFLYDEGGLTFGAAMSPQGRLDKPIGEPRPDGVTYAVARSGEAIIVEDTSRHPLFADVPAGWGEAFAIVGLPLKVGATVVGVMNVAYPAPHKFAESELRVLSLLAAQAAVAIQNARLHEQTQRYADELEQHVAERTRELTEAYEQLKALDRLKSKFITDVSHELRTPIANLNLYMDLLERGKPDKQPHYRAILKEQVARLVNLIEDVLDVSHLELDTTAADYAPVDLNAVVNQVVTALHTRAGVASLALTFAPDAALPSVRAVRDQLLRVVANLVANAIHYTPEGWVRVSTYQAGERVCLEVQDSGIGIDPEDVPHLFERFYRGRNVSHVPGNGLGLAIVHEIVSLHGGTLEVESRLGQGSTFRVWLPVG